MSRNLRFASSLRTIASAPRAVGVRAVSNAAGSSPLQSSSAEATSSTASSSSAGGRTTHFGFKDVPEEDKESLGEC